MPQNENTGYGAAYTPDAWKELWSKVEKAGVDAAEYAAQAHPSRYQVPESLCQDQFDWWIGQFKGEFDRNPLAKELLWAAFSDSWKKKTESIDEDIDKKIRLCYNGDGDISEWDI